MVFFPERTLARFAPAPAVDGALRIADEEVVRIAMGAGRVFSASFVAAARGEGDLGRLVLEPFVLLPAARNGEAVREAAGGVALREGGLDGRLMVGLSQEEKKSSAGSPAGVDVPSAGVVRASSVMTTSSGYLVEFKYVSSKGGIVDILLSISFGPTLELFLVLVRCVGGVFDFGVFAGESGAATVGLEEFGRGLVASNFHGP